MSKGIRHFWSPEAEAGFKAAYQAVMQQWPVPQQERYVSTRFGETHVVVCGPQAAAPVVLLNPGGGSAAIWIHNVAALGKVFRVYAVDVIGEMNLSVPTHPIRNHSEFAAWMTDIFAGLQIDRAHIIGNSNGGFFSLETALLLSDRVNKVVLISPAATFVQMWAFWFRLLLPAHIIAPILRSERMLQQAYAWLWQDFPADPTFERLRLVSKLAGYPRYRPSINTFAPHVFSDDELKRIKAPILLLIGDHEVIYSPARVIRRATGLVANLKAEIVPNANHSAQYTAPEFVNARVLEFLSSDEE